MEGSPGESALISQGPGRVDWRETFHRLRGAREGADDLCLNCLRQKTAIDADVGAGDKAAGFMAGKEHGHADQLAGFAEAGHWGVTPNRSRAGGGAAVVVEEEPAILLTREKARGD